MTQEDIDIFDQIVTSGDVAEEPRVFSGNLLIQEVFSSATVGKKATVNHNYNGTAYSGFSLLIEDV